MASGRTDREGWPRTRSDSMPPGAHVPATASCTVSRSRLDTGLTKAARFHTQRPWPATYATPVRVRMPEEPVTVATQPASTNAAGDARPVAGGAARWRPQAVRRGRGGHQGGPGHRGRRVLLDARAVGFGQDHHPAHDRGLRAADRGAGAPGRRRCLSPAALGTGRQYRVPGLRAVPAHERRGQRGLRPDDPQGLPGRAATTGRGRPPHGPPRGLRSAQAGTAVGRPAPARGARARARQPAAGAAARRAAGRPGPQAAPGDAAGAEVHPAGDGHHLHLRHPRPGRGARDERPDRDLLARPHRAGGHAGGCLRAARRRRSWPASWAPPTCSMGAVAQQLIGRPGHLHGAPREDPPGGTRRGRARRLGRPSTVTSGMSSTSAPTPAITSRSTRAGSSRSSSRT